MRRPERKRPTRSRTGATRAETAAHFDVSVRAVHQWHAAGWLVTLPDGSVDLAATAARVEANRDPDRGGKPDRATGADVTLAEARRRKEAALADLREMEAKKMRDELLDAADVVRGWQFIVRTAKANLQNLPPRLAAAMHGLDIVAAEAVALREIDAVLTQLADTKYEPEVPA